MFGDILQPTHLLFVLVIALLVLGPKRLPEAARGLGSGLRDFRATFTGEPTQSSQSPLQQPRQTPEYVHAPPEEPLFKAPVEPEPIELSPVDATVVAEPTVASAPRTQGRTSDPLA